MTRIGLEQRGAKRFTLFCTFIQPVRYEYRGRRDVYTGAARIREGGGSGAHVDTGDGKQSRLPLRRPGQDGGGGRDVCAGAAKIREGKGSGSLKNAINCS